MKKPCERAGSCERKENRGEEVRMRETEEAVILLSKRDTAEQNRIKKNKCLVITIR